MIKMVEINCNNTYCTKRKDGKCTANMVTQSMVSDATDTRTLVCHGMPPVFGDTQK